MNHPMMNPVWGYVAGAVSVALMLVFIGIWVWAWRKRHRANFQRMAELPMEDKPDGAVEPTPDERAAHSQSAANDKETRR